MRRANILALCLSASGCHPLSKEDRQLLTPPAAYVRFEDRVAARMLNWGIPWRIPCTKTVKENGLKITSSLPEDQCVKFDAPRRWQGLWRNEFEGSQFCPAPARECSFGDPRKDIWLDFSFSLSGDDRMKQFGALYAVDFIGRRAAYHGAYGHMGMSGSEVIADRMISMKQIEPPHED